MQRHSATGIGNTHLSGYRSRRPLFPIGSDVGFHIKPRFVIQWIIWLLILRIMDFTNRRRVLGGRDTKPITGRRIASVALRGNLGTGDLWMPTIGKIDPVILILRHRATYGLNPPGQVNQTSSR